MSRAVCDGESAIDSPWQTGQRISEPRAAGPILVGVGGRQGEDEDEHRQGGGDDPGEAISNGLRHRPPPRPAGVGGRSKTRCHRRL